MQPTRRPLHPRTVCSGGIREPHSCSGYNAAWFSSSHDNPDSARVASAGDRRTSRRSPLGYSLGRNMFGPVREPWPDDSWKGWWGDEPPYHTPVFVLAHHPREPLQMAGGTVFHFVGDGIQAALAQATAAAGGLDVRLGGGVATLRQYLRAGLVDELHLAVSPVLLGAGEPLRSGIDLHALGYECSDWVAGERATHVFLRRC